jgi:hypothetical protein
MMNTGMPRCSADELIERLLHPLEIELFGIRAGRQYVSSYIVRLLADGFCEQRKCIRPMAGTPATMGGL